MKIISINNTNPIISYQKGKALNFAQHLEQQNIKQDNFTPEAANVIKVQALYPRTLYPFPTDWIKDFIKNKEFIVVVEANYNAQFKSTIVERCVHINKSIEVFEFLKYDGTPFTPEEIYDEILKVANIQMARVDISTNKHTHF